MISDRDYVSRILTSRVYEVANVTPLDEAQALSRKFGCRFLLKREDLQPVHSYKIRGAYNKMSGLPSGELAKGVVCASAGNHAQGVALSAKKLGAKATIVMPVTTPEIKTAAVRAYGASIVLFGDSYSDTYEELHRQIDAHGYTYIAPFDDPDVIAGQGTVGKEIVEQAGRALTSVFVPIGGGGLAAGISVYIKSIKPDVKVYGVEPVDSDCMSRSLAAGRRVTLENPGLFADGVCVKTPGRETFRLCRHHLDGIVRVTTAETCAAIKDIFEATRAICEPAGALALAAAKKTARKGETCVCVISGANMNFDRLRFVSELTESGERREAIFDICIPERPGSFQKLIAAVGRRSVTEFNYRMNRTDRAAVFVGLSVTNDADRAKLARAFIAAGFPTTDLTDDPVAREHIRHMVGGHCASAVNERLFSFEFPEKPGALLHFLSVIAGRWNISLFHYRNHGSDHGRVLVGFQIPARETRTFADAMRRIGYPYEELTGNAACRDFL